MGPDLTAPGTRTACPSCGGRVRPEATFCGQCYTDFRPPPPPPPVAAVPIAPAPTAAYGTPAADPLTAPLLDVVLPAGAVPLQGAPAAAAPAPAAAPAAVPADKPTGWPCSKCDALNDFSATVCAVCASPFLAVVSETHKVSLVLPVVGDLARYGRGQRALIAVGALLAVLVPLALITLLMTHTPPSGSGGSGGSGGTGGRSSQTTGSADPVTPSN